VTALVKSGVVLGLAWGLLGAQVSGPERRVSGKVITSEHEPAVRIELPKAANYLGADRFVLYGIADCELHAWVEADAEKKVSRLYWLQFEGYLPSKPELHHTYNSSRHANLGGMDFYVDTWVGRRVTRLRRGRTVNILRGCFAAKGTRCRQA
jgi:hypothetical protein